MRRHFIYPVFFPLVIAAAMTGCQREPLPGVGEPIRFSVGPVAVSTASTKADDLPDIAAPASHLVEDGSTFKLWGSKRIGTGAWDYVFEDVDFTYGLLPSASQRSWNPSMATVPTWVEGAEYRFRAAHRYPAGTIDYQTGTSAEQLVVNYRMLSENYDLMVAAASTTSAAQAGDPVPLNFQHACAAVRFVFRKSAAAGDAVYKITKFELQYLQTVGTMIYKASTSGEALGWSFTGDDQTAHVYSTTEDWAMTDKFEEFSAGKWYFVIPQTLHVTQGEPAVEFSFVAGNNPESMTNIKLPQTTWEAGKVYVYYITHQPDSSSLTVSVQDWDAFRVAVDDVIFGI